MDLLHTPLIQLAGIGFDRINDMVELQDRQIARDLHSLCLIGFGIDRGRVIGLRGHAGSSSGQSLVVCSPVIWGFSNVIYPHASVERSTFQ